MPSIVELKQAISDADMNAGFTVMGFKFVSRAVPGNAVCHRRGSSRPVNTNIFGCQIQLFVQAGLFQR